MILVIVTIFIDESVTHDSDITVMSRWVGRSEQWVTFDQKWKSLLKPYNLSYFHSKKMRHSEGEFKGWLLSQKHEFIKDNLN
jgi:hypothetical protein